MNKFSSKKSIGQRGKFIFRVIASTIIIFISTQVIADMFDFLKKYDVHLSPEVHGAITLNGLPVEGITVERNLNYDKVYIDKTATDKQGKFHFPEINIRSRRPGKMLDETRNRQAIFAYYNNADYLLWLTTTDSVKPIKKFSEILNNLVCELTSPEMSYYLKNDEHPDFPYPVKSICHFVNDHPI